MNTKPDPDAGATEHIVLEGECLHSIASHHGTTAENIVDDPRNQELFATRESEAVVIGDRLFLPPIESNEETVETDTLHEFEIQVPEHKLRLNLALEHESGTPYKYSLEIDNRHTTDGLQDLPETLEIDLPPAPRRCVLRIYRHEKGSEAYRIARYDIHFGSLIPLPAGGDPPPANDRRVLQRLKNLGYLPYLDTAAVPAPDADDQDLRLAVKLFQIDRGISSKRGKFDDQTWSELRRYHGA